MTLPREHLFIVSTRQSADRRFGEPIGSSATFLLTLHFTTACTNYLAKTKASGILYICYRQTVYNQAFCEMPKDSRHFVKSLMHLGIYFQAFHVMPGFELQAFREVPKSDAPIIFSLSPVTTGVYAACIGSGLGISEDLVAQRSYVFQQHFQGSSISRCSIISCGRLIVMKLTLASHPKVAAKGVDRVSVPSPIAIDILMDTIARDRAHMYLFSV